MRTPFYVFVFATAAASASCATSSSTPSHAASASSSSADVAARTDTKLRASLAGPQRTPEERARDVYRHPRETLSFFGLRDDMTVVELSAGQGWYTAVLGPVLREKGKLFVTSADPNGPPDSEATKNAKALQDRFRASPNELGAVQTVVVTPGAPSSFGPDGSADLVLTFRSVHGWVANNRFDDVLATAFRVLKPGGKLGVVEHRAKPGTQVDPKVVGDTGYVPEDYVIARAQAAGFKLGGKSEINANPKDTKDYPRGVWQLPPTLRDGDQDRAKYVAIGESDRMTVVFLKP